MTILLALLVFSVIVIVHELGHYWTAKKAGILVEEFSLGMGPRLLSFKRGETRWSLKLLPLGGSCAMLGEDGDDPDNKSNRSFASKSVGWRFIVLVGGSAMNFILAYIIAVIISLFSSHQVAIISDFVSIETVQELGLDIVTPYEAGLRIGDRITHINGNRVRVYGDFILEMLVADGSPIDLTINREGEILQFRVNPFHTGDRWIIGFVPSFGVGAFFPQTQTTAEGDVFYIDEQPHIIRNSFGSAFPRAFNEVSFTIRSTFVVLSRLITGNAGAGELVGPVGIVNFLGDAIEAAPTVTSIFWTIMNFTLLLSANLGIINLLPIPAMDGGRLMFVGLEAIRRKPISPEKEGIIHFAGFVLLMILAAFIFYNDILRIIS